jgi:hypothetical protein
MSLPSAQQVAANRQNAQLSTGPITPEGKEIVSRNATKHGLLASELVFQGDKEVDVQALIDDMRASLRPVGTLEESLVDRITSHIWRLRRIPELERDRYELRQAAQVQAKGIEAHDSADRFVKLDWFLLLQRYEVGIENFLRSNLEMLFQLQQRRMAQEAIEVAPAKNDKPQPQPITPPPPIQAPAQTASAELPSGRHNQPENSSRPRPHIFSGGPFRRADPPATKQSQFESVK